MTIDMGRQNLEDTQRKLQDLSISDNRPISTFPLANEIRSDTELRGLLIILLNSLVIGSKTMKNAPIHHTTNQLYRQWIKQMFGSINDLKIVYGILREYHKGTISEPFIKNIAIKSMSI